MVSSCGHMWAVVHVQGATSAHQLEPISLNIGSGAAYTPLQQQQLLALNHRVRSIQIQSFCHSKEDPLVDLAPFHICF